MYEFKVFTKDNDVKYQTVNANGQTIRMIFFKWYYPYKRRIDWYVCFDIVDKRKESFKYKQQTGTDGLKSLIWAKGCIKDFIDKEIDREVENVIIVQWDDNKRRKAYERGLKELGFKLTNFDKRMSLLLKIPQNAGLE